MNDTSVNASRIHSTGDLSALWLLRRPDGITRRQDVEKAIRLGLPLWPDAVRMARLHHRSNDDLAGGMFYYVSKDFVDDKGDGDNFMYHEYGRYHGVLCTSDYIKTLDNVDLTSPIREPLRRITGFYNTTNEDFPDNAFELMNYQEQQMENYNRTCGDISRLSLSQTSGNKSFCHNIPNANDAASDLRPYTLLTSLATIPNFNSVQVPPANYIATNMIPLIMSLSNNSFTTMGSRPHVLEASVNSTDISITSCYEEFSPKATSPILVEYPTDIISSNTFTASFVHAESLCDIPEDLPIIPFARSLGRFVTHSESETDVFKPPDIDLRYMLQKDREHEIRLFLNIVRTMKEENTYHMEDAGIENNSDAITHINDKITVATSIRCGTRSVKTSSSVCVMSSCHPKSFELERSSRSDLSSLSQSHSSFFNDISDLFPSYITQIPNEIWSRNEGAKMNKITHCFSILNETVDFPMWRIFQKPRIKELIITQIKQLSGIGTSRNDYLESRDSIVPLLSEFSSVDTTLFDESIIYKYKQNYDREAKSITCRCDDCIKQLLNEKNYYPSSGPPVMHFGPNKNYLEFATKQLLVRSGDSISASLQKALTHVMNMSLDFESNRDFTVEHPLPIEVCNFQHFLSGSRLKHRLIIDAIGSGEHCITSVGEQTSHSVTSINNNRISAILEVAVPLLNNKFEDTYIEKPDVCSEELCSLNVIDGDSTFIDPHDVNGDVDDMDDIGEFIFAEISELRMAEGASPTGSHCTDEEACGDSALLGLDMVERAAMTCPAGRMLPVISFESISEPTLQIVEIIVKFSSNSYNVEVGRIFPERIFDQMSLSIELCSHTANDSSQVVSLIKYINKITASNLSKHDNVSITNNSLDIILSLISSVLLIQQLKNKITNIEMRFNAKIQWKRKEKIEIEKNKLLDELISMQENLIASISTTSRNKIQPAEIEEMLLSDNLSFRTSELELSPMHQIELQDLSTRVLLIEEIMSTYKVTDKNLKAKRKILSSRLRKSRKKISREQFKSHDDALDACSLMRRSSSYTQIEFQEDVCDLQSNIINDFDNHSVSRNKVWSHSSRSSSVSFKASLSDSSEICTGTKKRGRPRKRSHFLNHEVAVDNKYVLIKEKRARKQSCSEHGTENLSEYTAIVMKNESNCNQKRGDDEGQQNNEKHVMNSFMKKQNVKMKEFVKKNRSRPRSVLNSKVGGRSKSTMSLSDYQTEWIHAMKTSPKDRKRLADANHDSQSILAKRCVPTKEPDDIMSMLENGTMPSQAIGALSRPMATAIVASGTASDHLRKRPRKPYMSEYILNEIVDTPSKDIVSLDFTMDPIVGDMAAENINDMYYRTIEDDQMSLACQPVSFISLVVPKIEQDTPTNSPLKQPLLNIRDGATFNNLPVPDQIVTSSSCKASLSKTSTVIYGQALSARVSVDITAHFSALKLDTKQCSEPFISPIPNVHESVISNFRSSLVGEQIEAIAINNTISEACESLFDLAVFGDFVLYLYQSTVPLLGNFRPLSMFSTSLSPNFLSIFNQAPDIQYRHKLDYQSLNALLKERLTEIGFLALATNPKRISITKISKFLDKIKIAAHEIFDELLKVPNLTKDELKDGKILASNVISILSSRYIESIMKVTDSLRGIIIRSETIADQFTLLLSGWSSFIDQGGILRVFIHIGSSSSHPSILEFATQWLNMIDTVLIRARSTVYDRSSMVAAELADAKGVGVKLWTGLRQRQNTSMVPTSNFPYNCEDCNLHFSSEEYFLAHHLLLHDQPYKCSKCFDLFHTQLGLELHMVKYHKKYLINSFT